MWELERAMAAAVDMTALPHGSMGVKVTVTLNRDTELYDILSSAWEYARQEGWDEDIEEDPADNDELRVDPRC